MIRKLVLTVGLGVALAGCQSVDWGKVAAGTGLVIAGSGVGATTDPVVAKAGAQLERYCPLLRIAADVATESLSDKARAASLQASAALREVCLAPPVDTAAAAIVAERAYAAARAAKIAPPS